MKSSSMKMSYISPFSSSPQVLITNIFHFRDEQNHFNSFFQDQSSRMLPSSTSHHLLVELHDQNCHAATDYQCLSF